MRSKPEPIESLEDIIVNASRVERYIDGLDRAAFAADEMIRDAVERCLERMCEAGHRLGEHAGALMPGHSWSDIRGMGNQLRHAYHQISVDTVRNAACFEVPKLAADGRLALARLQQGQGASA